MPFKKKLCFLLTKLCIYAMLSFVETLLETFIILNFAISEALL